MKHKRKLRKLTKQFGKAACRSLLGLARLGCASDTPFSFETAISVRPMSSFLRKHLSADTRNCAEHQKLILLQIDNKSTVVRPELLMEFGNLTPSLFTLTPRRHDMGTREANTFWHSVSWNFSQPGKVYLFSKSDGKACSGCSFITPSGHHNYVG